MTTTMRPELMNDVTCSALPREGKFATVVVDPPWFTKGRHTPGSEPEYYKHRLMTDAEIQALPIPEILQDDAFVFLWTFNKHLPAAHQILQGWGLEFMFEMTWIKNTSPQPATWPNINSEMVLVGRKGMPRFIDTKAFKTANEWRRTGLEHSQKPPEFYELLARVSPVPRIDVFNRRVITGFHGWGAESPYPSLAQRAPTCAAGEPHIAPEPLQAPEPVHVELPEEAYDFHSAIMQFITGLDDLEETPDLVIVEDPNTASFSTDEVMESPDRAVAHLMPHSEVSMAELVNMLLEKNKHEQES